MEQVNVALRVRPLLPAEKERGENENITVLPGGTKVQVISHINRANQNQIHTFDMDYCLGPEINQENMFRAVGVTEMCDAVFEGKAATVMCFGQTGSGKTYTMSGRIEGETGLVAEDGIQYTATRYLTMVRDRLMTDEEGRLRKVIMRASYMELFNERINDLLNGSEGLKCRWSRDANSFFVEDLMVVECLNTDDFILVLREGQMRRKRAEHLLNADSSRSHVLFTVYVEVVEDDRPARHGKITFVDLAGSERLRDTGSHGEDSKSINRSLFALGNVVEKLSKGRPPHLREHIPYRSSVLTQLLMDTLDGGCRTLLVVCVTPSSRFIEESLRTIHFAQRARHIRSRIVERVDAAQQEMYALKLEIQTLRAENSLLRRALSLPETGPIPTAALQRQPTDQSTAMLSTVKPITEVKEREKEKREEVTIPQLIVTPTPASAPTPRSTAMDLLKRLPNSTELAARQRLPPTRPAGLGFHAVPKKNKLFGM